MKTILSPEQFGTKNGLDQQNQTVSIRFKKGSSNYKSYDEPT